VGRHSDAAQAKQPSRPLILAILALALAVALAVTVTALWAGGHLGRMFATSEPGCTEPDELVVVADPSVAPALTEVAAALTRPVC
jgi:hypothetical protein